MLTKQSQFSTFLWGKSGDTLHHVTDIELSKTLLRAVVKTTGIGGSKTV